MCSTSLKTVTPFIYTSKTFVFIEPTCITVRSVQGKWAHQIKLGKLIWNKQNLWVFPSAKKRLNRDYVRLLYLRVPVNESNEAFFYRLKTLPGEQETNRKRTKKMAKKWNPFIFFSFLRSPTLKAIYVKWRGESHISGEKFRCV